MSSSLKRFLSDQSDEYGPSSKRRRVESSDWWNKNEDDANMKDQKDSEKEFMDYFAEVQRYLSFSLINHVLQSILI